MNPAEVPGFIEPVHQSLTMRPMMLGLPRLPLLGLALAAVLLTLWGLHAFIPIIGVVYVGLRLLFKKDQHMDSIALQNVGPRREEP